MSDIWHKIHMMQTIAYKERQNKFMTCNCGHKWIDSLCFYCCPEHIYNYKPSKEYLLVSITMDEITYLIADNKKPYSKYLTSIFYPNKNKIVKKKKLSEILDDIRNLYSNKFSE